MSSFILESAILQEAKIVKETPGKAIFRCTIQTADDINANKRMYPRMVLENGMQNCAPRMRSRAFLSELDHPIPQGGAFDQIRQTTVQLKEVSHIIRDYEWKGNHLVAEMETTSTPNGGILCGLLRDNSGIGFSMRGLAELERLQEYNMVKGPLTIIAFDAVSQPSHKAAVVNFSEMQFESSMLMESVGQICVNGRCFLPDYFDKLVESRIVTFFDKWV
jgi:hypothetical protein